MQDAHLKLVAVLNTLLCLCLVVGNWLFNYLGIVKVRVRKLTTSAIARQPSSAVCRLAACTP
jgi:hypothetical protein